MQEKLLVDQLHYGIVDYDDKKELACLKMVDFPDSPAPKQIGISQPIRIAKEKIYKHKIQRSLSQWSRCTEFVILSTTVVNSKGLNVNL